MSEFQAKLYKVCHFLEKVVMRGEIDCLATDVEREEVLTFLFHLKSSLKASSVGVPLNQLGIFFANAILANAHDQRNPSVADMMKVDMMQLLAPERMKEDVVVRALALSEVAQADRSFARLGASYTKYWRERSQGGIRSLLCLLFLARCRVLEKVLPPCNSMDRFAEVVFLAADDVHHSQHAMASQLVDLVGCSQTVDYLHWFNRYTFWTPEERVFKFKELVANSRKFEESQILTLRRQKELLMKLQQEQELRERWEKERKEAEQQKLLREEQRRSLEEERRSREELRRKKKDGEEEEKKRVGRRKPEDSHLPDTSGPICKRHIYVYTRVSRLVTSVDPSFNVAKAVEDYIFQHEEEFVSFVLNYSLPER